MTRCSIRFENGNSVACDSVEAAGQYLAEYYPEAVYCDGDGDISPIPLESYYDRDGRILVWACERDSVNDAGAKAVAEIVADTE